MQLNIEHNHEVKSGIYARAVKAGRKHLAVAAEMVSTMDALETEWGDKYGMKAWAIAHCQFNDVPEPLQIFVVHPQLINPEESNINARFPARAIFNAILLEAPKEITTTKRVRKTVMNKETGRREIKNVPVEHHAPNTHKVKEGCMSFPLRKPKNVERVFRVKVRYWYPRKVLGMWFLWRRTEVIEGLKAQIFQHEIQHFEASNIFYEQKRRA